MVKTEVSAAAAKEEGLLDQAKALVTQQKWAEALQLLASLSQQELTTEQQSLVQKLQTQAQQGAAASAKASAESQPADTVNKLLIPKR